MPVRVPESLARPQLVTAVAPGELRVDPLQRWAEPLDEGATRTLAENLAALLPRFRVVRAPWPASTPLRARLSVELSAFGPQPDGAVQPRRLYVLLDPKEERALARQAFSLARPGPVRIGRPGCGRGDERAARRPGAPGRHGGRGADGDA